MARNGSGFFNKFLNAIGIVDEPQPQDQFENRYGSGRPVNRDYAGSRPSTYVPRQENSRTADTRRRSVVQDERPSARYNPQTRNTYNNINEGYTERPANAEPEDEFAAAAAAGRRSEAPRRAPEPAPRAAAPAPRNSANAPAPVNRAPAAPSTLMFTLNSLEECGEVVEALIANNIVLLTLDQLDDRMIQRAIDTLSGAAFALRATIRKASEKTYLIAPRSVSVNDLISNGRRGM